MSQDDFGFSIDLTVRNEWRNIDLLRTSVQNCFIAVFADLDGCHAIAMVTGELLENALKYGDWSTRDARCSASASTASEGNIEVSVQNPLKKDDHERAEADEVDRVARLASRSRSGLSRAHAADRAGRGGGIGPSRLGLARIAFEGNCRITAKIENGTVTVNALLLREGE